MTPVPCHYCNMLVSRDREGRAVATNPAVAEPWTCPANPSGHLIAATAAMPDNDRDPVKALREIADQDIGGNAPWLADELHGFADRLAASMRGDSPQSCYFWDIRAGECHFEMLVLDCTPCAACPARPVRIGDTDDDE